jgi:putative endonuclease
MWKNFRLSPLQKIGRDHESEALGYFKRRGWKLVERNFTCKAGEIDLIMEDPAGYLVFVEVKFRASSAYGQAQEFVDWRKQGRVGRAALLYVKQHKLGGRFLRFDVAAVTPDGLSHIENAFCPEGYYL